MLNTTAAMVPTWIFTAAQVAIDGGASHAARPRRKKMATIVRKPGRCAASQLADIDLRHSTVRHDRLRNPTRCSRVAHREQESYHPAQVGPSCR